MKKILFLTVVFSVLCSVAAFAASHPYDEESKSLPKVIEEF
jgi:hypothetical protein